MVCPPRPAPEEPQAPPPVASTTPAASILPAALLLPAAPGIASAALVQPALTASLPALRPMHPTHTAAGVPPQPAAPALVPLRAAPEARETSRQQGGARRGHIKFLFKAFPFLIPSLIIISLLLPLCQHQRGQGHHQNRPIASQTRRARAPLNFFALWAFPPFWLSEVPHQTAPPQALSPAPKAWRNSSQPTNLSLQTVDGWPLPRTALNPTLAADFRRPKALEGGFLIDCRSPALALDGPQPGVWGGPLWGSPILGHNVSPWAQGRVSAHHWGAKLDPLVTTQGGGVTDLQINF